MDINVKLSVLIGINKDKIKVSDFSNINFLGNEIFRMFHLMMCPDNRTVLKP